MSDKKNIDVSFVMTVYNKEYYLPSVLKALLGQVGLENPEFIFIDDLSTDKSVDIIKKFTRNVPNVILAENKDNRGISPRINQGIALAHGKYVRMLDSDDIFPIDSTRKMLDLAEEINADMVYGCFVKTGKEPQFLENETMGDFSYTYWENALDGVLHGRFTRMGQLIKTEVLKKAKGADERVFIQDESIPIRAAIYAHGIVKMDADVVLVPKEIGNFSGNKLQLDNDRFMAYYYAIVDHPHLEDKAMRLMYKRAVSAYWKLVRKTQKCPYCTKAFILYLRNKIAPAYPDLAILQEMKAKFDALDNIRRVQNPLWSLES